MRTISPKFEEKRRQPASGQTGPKTPAGKARSALNALKHGITARSIIPGESGSEYETFFAETVAAFRPVGAAETELARKVATSLWQLRRVDRWAAASARTAPAGGEQDTLHVVAETSGKIGDLRVTLRDLQRDPASEPPLLVELPNLPDDQPVDGYAAAEVFDLWANQLPRTCPVPEFVDVCQRIGIPERPKPGETEAGGPQSAGGHSPTADTCPAPSSNTDSSTSTLASSRECDQPAGIPSAKERIPEGATTCPKPPEFDPSHWKGWTARLVRRLVTELVAIQGTTFDRFIEEADARWRTGLADARAERRLRRSAVRKEIRALEQRQADLLVIQTIPDPGRADLLARYEGAAMRKLEKFVKILEQLQRTRKADGPRGRQPERSK